MAEDIEIDIDDLERRMKGAMESLRGEFASLRTGLARLAGSLSDQMLRISHSTIQSVVLGLVGTAIAQGAVAVIGFLIAGVPNAFLLGGLTALLSILPGGTVLVWLGATMWLLSEQQTGWAIFMAAVPDARQRATSGTPTFSHVRSSLTGDIFVWLA